MNEHHDTSGLKPVRLAGTGLFVLAFLLFVGTLAISRHSLTPEHFDKIVTDTVYAAPLKAEAKEMFGKEYASQFSFINDFQAAVQRVNTQASAAHPQEAWKYQVPEYKTGEYRYQLVRASSTGAVREHSGIFLLLTFGLGALGALMIALPKLQEELPGIKNNRIFQSVLTSVDWTGLSVGGVLALLAAVFNLGGSQSGFYILASAFFLAAAAIYFLRRTGSLHESKLLEMFTMRHGWIGIAVGVFLIVFYILLYKAPEYIVSWIEIVDPVSYALKGTAADRWFMYGLLYTVVIVVMGVRMLVKYRHSPYQVTRTVSVMFFQTVFAFLIPQVLARLHLPEMDLKNMWPLDYSFFFDYRINSHIQAGTVGIAMLVWGIALFLIGVPVLTYFYGKRWYCSWVCGCGGLAETLGDPYRHLSDKSLRAWQIERVVIHSVLVFAIVMTLLVLYTYFTGESQVLGLNSYQVRDWYGFYIGFGFAGFVGTGFYPFMGSRAWCRFGCPLAAYLGLVQRFSSRFRITTNGGQCISCGNCSTYCEMGIDVRAYAQRGENIVRSSCVGCGICAAVCPRGVLALENGPAEARFIFPSSDLKILS